MSSQIVLCCRAGSWTRTDGVTAVVARGPHETPWSDGWHTSAGRRPTTLEVTVRRYRCTDCGHMWRQDTSRAADPRWYELMRADLRGLRLVTLSACETALAASVWPTTLLVGGSRSLARGSVRPKGPVRCRCRPMSCSPPPSYWVGWRSSGCWPRCRPPLSGRVGARR